MNRRTAVLTLARGAVAVAAADLVVPAVLAQAAPQQAAPQQALVQPSGTDDAGVDALSSARVQKPSPPILSSSTVQATERAVAAYEAIVARGGWPQIPQVDTLAAGTRHSAVQTLRQRLIAVGDLDAQAEAGDLYDAQVEAGVRRFQARHGVSADGIVRGATLGMLNVPAPARLGQLRMGLMRLRALNMPAAARFVVCNIPAAEIEAVENDTVAARYTAVVGKPERPSPDIQGRIVEINFNPYWTVPVSIVRRDLMPKMLTEPDYLAKNRIRVFDAASRELSARQINWYSEQAAGYKFKQDPGDLNSLGSVRINFPNTHDVYMHDTPFKSLFGEDFRFLSSGCVRVQNIRDLVTWLLETSRGWTRTEIDEVIRSGVRRDVRIAPAVPLHWIYLTGWGTPDGLVQFREDIYRRDGQAGAFAVRG